MLSWVHPSCPTMIPQLENEFICQGLRTERVGAFWLCMAAPVFKQFLIILLIQIIWIFPSNALPVSIITQKPPFANGKNCIIRHVFQNINFNYVGLFMFTERDEFSASSSIQLSATGRLLDITYMCYEFRTPLFPAQPLEVVNCYINPQPQVVENYSYLLKY